MTEPLCRLVRFEATDGAELSGLLYEPRRKTAHVAVFLHGTGGSSVFDSHRTNRLAEVFLERRIAWLPFNNRGSHLVRRVRLRGRKKSLIGGMAYEMIRDSVHDIEGSIRFALRRGYRDVTLIGHSTGANKIAVYDHLRRGRSRARRYVLLAGGDDVGLMFQQLGAARFRTVLRRARERRRSGDLVPRNVSALPMSWRALFDMINPDGDYNVFPFLEAWGRTRLSRRPLFRHLLGIRKPVLVVYGEKDEYCFGDVSGAVRAMAEAVGAKPNFEYAVMEGADHGFGGYEEELGGLIADWITL